MPILKTEILGSEIEINYKEEEKERLEKIINKFNHRIKDFQNLHGKVSDKKILFLAALKAEDEINEINENKKNINNNKINSEKIIKLNQEIINLKDEINTLQSKSIDLKNNNTNVAHEIDTINNQLDDLIKKILADENEYD